MKKIVSLFFISAAAADGAGVGVVGDAIGVEAVLAHEDNGICALRAARLDDGRQAAAADRLLHDGGPARLTFHLKMERSTLSSNRRP